MSAADEYVMVPKAFVADNRDIDGSPLTPSDKMLWVGIAAWDYTNGQPTVEDLSALVGVSVRQVHKSTQRLELSGWLVVIRRPGRRSTWRPVFARPVGVADPRHVRDYLIATAGCGARHRRLAERDGGWFCHYCANPVSCWCGVHSSDGEVCNADHVIPKSRGGPNGIDNLVLACGSCNAAKGVKSYDDFMAEVRP